MISDSIEGLDFSDPEMMKIFKMTSVLFAPPLYIGKSTDLFMRLKTHTDELRRLISDKEIIQITFDNVPNDTLEESTSFAKRIVAFLNSNLNKDNRRQYSITSFIIKVIKIKSDNIGDKEIKDLEFFFNRTFKPILGKK